LVMLALVACTNAPSGQGPPSPPGPPLSNSPGPSAHTGTEDPTLFVRTCESRVDGDLGRGWRRGEISAGPVTFVGAKGYADDPEDLFSAPGELATSQKVLVVVDGDRPVLLSVRHPDAGLAYDPARWRLRNTVPFRLGYPLTRFEPCASGDRRSTQFNGAFLLRGPACVPLEVRPEGGKPIFITLSFGAGDCA
jgi:hypothetical protein